MRSNSVSISKPLVHGWWSEPRSHEGPYVVTRLSLTILLIGPGVLMQEPVRYVRAQSAPTILSRYSSYTSTLRRLYVSGPKAPSTS